MLKVARYRTWDELQELRTVWNPLLSRSASDTVFLTWEWLTAWWRNYGTGREIFVLAAFEGKELVGIAPLYVEDVRLYGSDWRRLRLIGDGSHDSDYLDCIAQRDRESETIASFFEFLEADHRSWNWIELNGSIQGSPCLAAAVQYARDKSWSFKTEQIRCAALPLHKTWDDYLRALQPRFRTKIRSSLALLNEYVKSTPDQCSSTAQIDDWLPALFDLHTRRWGTKSEPGVFLDSAKRAFYRDLSCAALEQGWLAFHRLSWCERPLAFQFGLLYKNRYHLLQEGYDPNFAAIRPGMALRAWLMRHWIETGIDEYDFLAGVSDYKLDWGAQEKSATRLLIAAQRKSALVALDMPRLQMQTRETLRHFTPAPLLSVRQKMMSRRGQQVRSANSKPSSPRSGIKGVARRLTSAIYSSTPVGKLGRLLATGYSWQPERNGGSFPLRRRSQPVCHILQYHRVNDDGDPFLGG